MQRRLTSLIAAVALLSLTGCQTIENIAGSATVFPTPAPAAITAALAVACPLNESSKGFVFTNPSVVRAVSAAQQVIGGFCPPNPAPTNAVVAVSEIVSATTVIYNALHNKAIPRHSMKVTFHTLTKLKRLGYIHR